MFAWQTTIKLSDTDAAGRIFFAALLRVAHDAFEVYMDGLGQPLARFLRGDSCSLAIIHAEADYRRPIGCGDALEVRVGVERVGTTSFVITYEFLRGEEEVATARTVHVAIDRHGSKTSLPDDLRQALSA